MASRRRPVRSRLRPRRASPAVLEDPAKPLSQHRVVVAEQHAEFINDSPPDRAAARVRVGRRPTRQLGRLAAGQRHLDSRAAAGALSMRTVPPRRAARSRMLRNPVRGACPAARHRYIEPDAVVLDRDAERPGFVAEICPAIRRFRVSRDVVERLLNNPVGGGFGLGLQPAVMSVVRELSDDLMSLAEIAICASSAATSPKSSSAEGCRK